MTPIGGFFELELPAACRPWHSSALALTSGRACLRQILEIASPARVLAPFYLCDTALQPMRSLGVRVEFYPLTETLDPDVDAWPGDAMALYVNYFDLKNASALGLVETLGSRAIIDDTQAFFRRGRVGAWSFNSARKFFGVPDGAYAYGDGLSGRRPSGRREQVRFEHLGSRVLGRQDAHQQYLEAEASVSDEILAPSALAERLLNGIGYDDARQARRRNFAALHRELGSLNTLPLGFTLDADAAPFCYPFLPSRGSLHEPLWQRGIFPPRLWPEIRDRRPAGFERERDLAARLLPLPIDHRYGREEMARVADAVLDLAA